MATWYVYPLTTDNNCIVWLTSGSQTAVFKNQIDWIPLSTGSVRPTQGRTLAIAQVSGGSQSFNTVNSLRLLGRWMRLFAIPNQSSIPQAYTQFTDAHDPKGDELDALLGAEGGSRLMPSSNRDRVVDCMEEFVKYTILMRPHFNLFADRYSERNERRLKEEKVAAQQLAKAALDENGAGADLVNGVNIKGL
jgi:arsenic resistance protein ArsH